MPLVRPGLTPEQRPFGVRRQQAGGFVLLGRGEAAGQDDVGETGRQMKGAEAAFAHGRRRGGRGPPVGYYLADLHFTHRRDLGRASIRSGEIRLEHRAQMP